jgi:hypothetical protein
MDRQNGYFQLNNRSTDSSEHFRHSTEMSTGIDTEEQVNRPAPSCLLECLVEPLVTRIRRAPDFVLE